MIGNETLLNPHLARTAQRIEARNIINAIVIDWVGSRGAAEVQQSCDKYDVPCSLLYSVADIFQDPHYQARGDLLTVDDKVNGRLVVPAPFPRMSETPATVDHLGLPLGACNREVFEGLLGMSSEEIEDLKKKGVI
jgi:crotonobetainyl-CoA:carnitine CoA-transferase CaiB-like acyl-CoA transferase